MPSFQFLGLEKQRAVAAHLRTLQGTASKVNLPGNVERGEVLFFAKAGCSNCHTAQGHGGFFGSDLTSFARARPAETVRSAIVSPNANLDPQRRTVVALFGNGESLRGIARNEDNFSLQLLTPDGVLHLFYKSSLAKLTYLNESPMPADYGTKLSPSELDDLIKFLASIAQTRLNQSGEDDTEDD